MRCVSFATIALRGAIGVGFYKGWRLGFSIFVGGVWEFRERGIHEAHRDQGIEIYVIFPRGLECTPEIAYREDNIVSIIGEPHGRCCFQMHR